jgi:hypothetical protein
MPAVGGLGRLAGTSRAGVEAGISTSGVAAGCPALRSLRGWREALPVELTERAVRDAIAMMGKWNHGNAQAAESALNWLGWEGEGPMLLRRYDVQLFLWYTLPVKFLTSIESKREAAEVLAYTLERLGGRAASYAELCSSTDTIELLRAWEAEDPSARRRLRDLLDGSGIEPPDTALLAWGSVWGLEEARVRDQVATALEEAIENGELSPGTPGFRRRQAALVDAALHEPCDAGDGRTRLETVHAERLERWLRRGNTRGSEERRAIISAVADALMAEPLAVDSAVAAVALAPAVWLLEQACDGIALTQTGALNRALVREVAVRWPNWWDAELFGPPTRQDDLALLCELDDLLRRLRLTRRSGRRIVTTARGRKLKADPAELLMTLASGLLAAENFRGACAELAVALILNGEVATYSNEFAALIYPAVVAEGWQASRQPPEPRHVRWTIADFLRQAEAIGLLERKDSGSPLAPDRLLLTNAGRVALTAGLRERALAPASVPY